MYSKIKKVYIEITNVCNLSCNFCPKTKRAYQFMNEEQFAHIVKQVKPYSEHIYFHIMGEPLLNDKISYFLEESERNQLKVNLTTNGTLLHKVGDKLIQAKALRQVNISLHSFEANEHSMTLDEYVDSVIAFVKKARENSDIICSIRLWNMDHEELKGANQLNQDIFLRMEEAFGLDFKLRDKLIETTRIKLADKVYLNMAHKFEWPDITKETQTQEVFCYGLRNQFGILVDGTVVPCCLDSEGTIALGNIYETPLDDILNGPRAVNVYEGFSQRKSVEELCKKCGYATRF